MKEGDIIPAPKDLTGYKYGKLTILRQVENRVYANGKSRSQYECECDCGNIILKTRDQIIAGKTQCRECAFEAMAKKERKNIEGQTFGYLTVLSIDRRPDKNGKQRAYCTCKCICGNITETKMDNLMKPGLHSCGCAAKEIADKSKGKEILVGQKYGRLTVLEVYKDCTPQEVLCECECGNRIRAIKFQVLSGHTQSCGCLSRERKSEAVTKDWTGYVSESGVTLNHQAYKQDGSWLWDCTCYCGNHFINRPVNIVTGVVKSCGCLKESGGELLVRKYLTEQNIPFVSQYSFDDCKNINVLYFDFAIPNADGSINSLIEFDGIQHFKPIPRFGGEERLQDQKKRDKIKDEYCKKNNIPLIRIPYYYSTDEIKQTLANIKLP